VDASEYRTDQEEQLDMTLNELFAIHEADVTGELLLKAGWSEIAEEPAEIFRRMKSLIRTFREGYTSAEKREADWFLSQVSVRGWNRRDSTYGKSFDRLIFHYEQNSYTVICNMTGAGAKYVIYATGKATPLEKCHSRMQMEKFLRSRLVPDGVESHKKYKS